MAEIPDWANGAKARANVADAGQHGSNGGFHIVVFNGNTEERKQAHGDKPSHVGEHAADNMAVELLAVHTHDLYGAWAQHALHFSLERFPEDDDARNLDAAAG